MATLTRTSLCGTVPVILLVAKAVLRVMWSHGMPSRLRHTATMGVAAWSLRRITMHDYPLVRCTQAPGG